MAGRCAEPSLLLTKAWAAAPDVAPPPTQGTVVGYSPTKCFVLTTHGASWNHIFVSIAIGCMLNGI